MSGFAHAQGPGKLTSSSGGARSSLPRPARTWLPGDARRRKNWCCSSEQPPLDRPRRLCFSGAHGARAAPSEGAKVYAQTMRRSADEQAQLAALMDGEKARKGTKADVVPIEQAKGTRHVSAGSGTATRITGLSATEIRVLGCLLEKQRTTPDAEALLVQDLFEERMGPRCASAIVPPSPSIRDVASQARRASRDPIGEVGSSAPRLCSVNRVSSVAVIAMPKLPPSWRVRLNRPVPCASCAGARSATARR